MSISADIYHLLFSPPPSEEVAGRLVQEEGGIQARLHAPLELYHRQSDALLSTFSCTCKTFSAHQPIDDLVSQGQTLISVVNISTHYMYTLIKGIHMSTTLYGRTLDVLEVCG